MDLVIDIGNTHAKYALSNGGVLGEVYTCESQNVVSECLRLLQGETVGSVAVSSVRRPDEIDIAPLWAQCGKMLLLDYRMPLPIKLNYSTPETLGADRIAAAIGARSLFPEENLLIIDFGTAITVDTVLKDGTFAGGNISAGLYTRLRALHQFTGRLPLIETLDDVSDDSPGQSTYDAMVKGVVCGITYEIEGYVAAHPGFRVVFTGGDALYFEKRIKYPIFAICNLVLTGLAYLTQCDAEEHNQNSI